MSQEFTFLLLAAISLFGLFFVSAFASVAALPNQAVFQQVQGTLPHFWRLHKRFVSDDSEGVFLFCLFSARSILLFFYVMFSCFFSSQAFFPLQLAESDPWTYALKVIGILIFFLLLIATILILSDILPRSLAFTSPQHLLRFTAKPSQFFLLVLSPLTLLASRCFKCLFPHAAFASFSMPKEQVLELLSGTEERWTETDKRLLQSVLNFRKRIAREIMRPRVGLFCIPENLTLQQAAELLQREGYSRVPVYRDTIDTIVGVLFYKDVLSKYAMAAESGADRVKLLTSPVKTLVKKVFYCPETKKIGSLLQEFRKRQTHLAVVVDEYGGTAGLVTIEDILEEIVGEISDEFDEQEALFSPAPDGGWIVDARMNLLDIEEELGIKIPQEEDYDTLAGYIFYRVGSIPQAGLVLHHDNFEIEILKSNDRMVEKVKINPIVGEKEGDSSSQERSLV